MGEVLPAKDQQEGPLGATGPLGVAGQLYALIAVVVEYPEYFYQNASTVKISCMVILAR